MARPRGGVSPNTADVSRPCPHRHGRGVPDAKGLTAPEMQMREMASRRAPSSSPEPPTRKVRIFTPEPSSSVGLSRSAPLMAVATGRCPARPNPDLTLERVGPNSACVRCHGAPVHAARDCAVAWPGPPPLDVATAARSCPSIGDLVTPPHHAETHHWRPSLFVEVRRAALKRARLDHSVWPGMSRIPSTPRLRLHRRRPRT
jgi:hypothetical protein